MLGVNLRERVPWWVCRAAFQVFSVSPGELPRKRCTRCLPSARREAVIKHNNGYQVTIIPVLVVSGTRYRSPCDMRQAHYVHNANASRFYRLGPFTSSDTHDFYLT